MCICLVRGGVGRVGVSGLNLRCTNPVGTRGVLDVCLCLGCGGVGGVGGVDGRLGPGSGVMSVCVVSLDSLC